MHFETYNVTEAETILDRVFSKPNHDAEWGSDTKRVSVTMHAQLAKTSDLKHKTKERKRLIRHADNFKDIIQMAKRKCDETGDCFVSTYYRPLVTDDYSFNTGRRYDHQLEIIFDECVGTRKNIAV